jgi:FAD/FMN-containing dehydrogenase
MKNHAEPFATSTTDGEPPGTFARRCFDEMNRRRFLQTVGAALPFLPTMGSWVLAPTRAAASTGSMSRVRPGDPGWPSKASWNRLRQDVGGRLVEVRSPLAACMVAPSSSRCDHVFQEFKNPFYLGDEVGLTQSLGWVDAWTSRPSVYAVAAETTDDVVLAVNFARENNLRLVVKGGGHSYQGTSNAADSLLIWTRGMNAITLHDGFIGEGCAGPPQPAVTIEAGAMWGPVYDAVMTQAGRYVQGGGCMTVGVAGLIQSGGFGSFSKAYGLAAASLLEAEIVTADGAVRIANACTNPDLFWGIKGGGGGSLGVVTRLTLQTHSLPEFVGVVFTTITATSDAAFRRLIGQVLSFYSENLLNPHWGEQIAFRPGRVLAIAVQSQGLDQQQTQTIWGPFFEWLEASPQDFNIEPEPIVFAAPVARYWWDPAFLRTLPGPIVLPDDRPGAPEENVFYASNWEETGQVLHGYQSAWLPASLLQTDEREKLGDALFAAAQHRGVTLHLNKGLAGAPAEAIDAARNTAMNPAVLDAFALVICAAREQPAYPGIPGHEPDLSTARAQEHAIEKAMKEVRKLVPNAGSYVGESDFFEKDWSESFWGPNYARLLAVKDTYDPDGLFFVHHGVGSERWSADGFRRSG